MIQHQDMFPEKVNRAHRTSMSSSKHKSVILEVFRYYIYQML